MTWIAITTKPGKALIVRRRLRRDGINAYLPAIVIKETVLRSNKAKRRRRIMPLMSYVLVEEPREFTVRHLMLVHVLNIRDVTGALGIKGLGPSIVPNSEVNDMKNRVKQIVLEANKRMAKHVLRKGNSVKVKSGPMAGKTGTISWVNKKRAELDMMISGGGMQRMTLRLEDLEAA